MLNPNARSLYTGALTPPPGMVFDSAIGTTFSLDPMTLLAVPVHLALLGSDRGNVLRDGIAVLEAVRRLASRVTIYAQRGRIQIPKHDHALYGLLESMVVEVRAPRGGVFHPKLWLLRFVDPSGYEDPLLRLMVLSRNLTADRSWDLALQLEGRPAGRQRADNRELGELVAGLPDAAAVDVPEPRRRQAEQLAEELRRTEWELPPGFESVEFLVFGRRRRAWRPERANRLAVISPFCTDEALRHLAALTRNADVLLSRPEALAGLSADTRARFGRCLVLDEATETEDGDEAEDAADRDTLGLHAKAYIFERGWNTHLVMGSANATDAALLASNNVEVLVELVGKRSQVGGVDQLLDADGLGEILVEFVQPEASEIDTERLAAQQSLEDARERIAGAELVAQCVRCAGATPTWRMTLAGKVADLEGVQSITAWPITVSQDHAVDLAQLLESGGVILGEFAPASLSGLIAFDLRSACTGVYLRFALNLPVEGLPEERDAAILQTVVRNRDGFLRYLLLLLGGIGEDALPPAMGGAAGAGYWNGRALENLPLLEELTRAYCREPDRLREVSQVVRQLADGDQDGSVVPPEFLELWQVFEAALGNRHE